MRKLKNEELNRLTVSEYKMVEKINIVIVLDNVRSLFNVGSVFRTCDAFKINEILLCGITGKPPHKEIHKTALGATESVNWRYFKTTEQGIDVLKKENYLIVSIEQASKSISLNDFNLLPEKKYAFVFGNEVNGVGNNIIKVSDFVVEIPQFGTKHSLNISVSAGIVIWDIFNKIKKG